MPINPNIALGVQPIQQPNMLGQVGQMMALKAAQQESEGYEGVKNALSGGMSATDPRILQYGKRGIEAFRAAGEGRVKQIEVAKKQNEVLGSIFGGVLQDPTTGPQAVSRLVEMGVMSKEQAQKVIEQAGNNPETWRKLAKPYYEGAIDAEKRLTAETSIKTANIGAGATMRGQDLLEARERDKMALTAQEREILPGEGEFYQKDKFGNIYRVPSFGALRGPNAPAPAMPPAAANAFVTQQQPSVNALAPTATPQGAGPTVANALAMEQQQNIPRPKVPIRQPVAVIKDGQVTLVPPEQAVGMTPATPGAEKALEKKEIAKEGKESVNRVLGNLYSEYGNLVKSGGITDTRKSVEENISARTGASAAGQLAGSFTGSEAQSFRDSIEQTRPLLLTAIMKATGLSATQLNSNVELQTYLKTATDPKVSIQSNVKALNNISQMFGIGEKFEVPEIKSPKETKAADAPPSGLSPEIAGLWKYMSPEDRKLWQK